MEEDEGVRSRSRAFNDMVYMKKLDLLIQRLMFSGKLRPEDAERLKIDPKSLLHDDMARCLMGQSDIDLWRQIKAALEGTPKRRPTRQTSTQPATLDGDEDSHPEMADHSIKQSLLSQGSELSAPDQSSLVACVESPPSTRSGYESLCEDTHSDVKSLHDDDEDHGDDDGAGQLSPHLVEAHDNTGIVLGNEEDDLRLAEFLASDDDEAEVVRAKPSLVNESHPNDSSTTDLTTNHTTPHDTAHGLAKPATSPTPQSPADPVWADGLPLMPQSQNALLAVQSYQRSLALNAKPRASSMSGGLLQSLTSRYITRCVEGSSAGSDFPSSHPL